MQGAVSYPSGRHLRRHIDVPDLIARPGGGGDRRGHRHLIRPGAIAARAGRCQGGAIADGYSTRLEGAAVLILRSAGRGCELAGTKITTAAPFEPDGVTICNSNRTDPPGAKQEPAPHTYPCSPQPASLLPAHIMRFLGPSGVTVLGSNAPAPPGLARAQFESHRSRATRYCLKWFVRLSALPTSLADSDSHQLIC